MANRASDSVSATTLSYIVTVHVEETEHAVTNIGTSTGLNV